LKKAWAHQVNILSNNTEDAKGSKAYEKQQGLINKMLEIPEAVRDAVLYKWLKYTKTEQLNDFMLWR
jgi:hypothetical protein